MVLVEGMVVGTGGGNGACRRNGGGNRCCGVKYPIL